MWGSQLMVPTGVTPAPGTFCWLDGVGGTMDLFELDTVTPWSHSQLALASLL